ncbi:MAG: type I DNA topoisomerase [Desulfovibrionaceae bacterium]|jgi:DNA topoisomerase-1|nr:type I DNA topoisomerase [Desulfovibrionaceae bacterium]
MTKDLIIVESPAKVKTIKKFLGSNYEVEASVGHVRDLPPRALGVDEDKDFEPLYEVIQGKQKVVNKLKSKAAKAEHVYLAPDPDREGEAIAWHVAELIKGKNDNVLRIQFNEITSRAVKEALEHPRELNRALFDSQQARRVLDRLVGYKLSPLLWKKVKRGISAGRVQSVALRLVVDREKERQAFAPQEFWTFKAQVADAEGHDFGVELARIDDKKAEVGGAAEAAALVNRVLGDPARAVAPEDLLPPESVGESAGRADADGVVVRGPGVDFVVQAVDEKERSRAPQPPFITSTLQQAASQRLGYGAKKTMSTAQRLYEGVELGDRGTVALITYMRTDSVRIADEARDAARAFITGHFGPEYYPDKPRAYKTKASAQDAHEAIRPVDVTLTPETVRPVLQRDLYSLYKLVWERFVASQMASARFWDTTVSLDAAGSVWRVKGERMLFPGFLAAMPAAGKKQTPELPKLEPDQALALRELRPEQKFTQPPPRYSEASLVRELEEKGIGRPSTYAAIISTLLDRDYATLLDKHFVPTDLGMIVCDQLVKHFPALLDVDFTATMEQSLDEVAEGQEDWVALMKKFTSDFYPTLEAAKKEMAAVKGGLETGIACELCGKPMVIKFGKAGTFLACSGYPACRNTKNFTRDAKGEIEILEKQDADPEIVGKCPDCATGDLVIKRSRTGSRFVGCNKYPECTFTAPYSTGVACPRDGCDGMLVEKSSRRGKIFYSCNRYPECDFAVWDWPVNEPCPECGSKILVRKNTRGKGEHLACPNRKCNYTRSLDEDGDGGAGEGQEQA